MLGLKECCADFGSHSYRINFELGAFIIFTLVKSGRTLRSEAENPMYFFVEIEELCILKLRN